MKHVLAVVAGTLFGWWLVKRAIPYMKARVEAMDLDSVWEVWDAEEWM